MVVVSSIVPNVGNVVNQNQGFIMNVDVTNDSAIALSDVAVVVTGLTHSDMTVGVGLNTPISLPVIAPGNTETIQVVFDTVQGIDPASHTITFTVNGYLGGPEWLTIASGAPFLFPVGLQGVYPLDPAGGAFSQTLTIHKE